MHVAGSKRTEFDQHMRDAFGVFGGIAKRQIFIQTHIVRHHNRGGRVGGGGESYQEESHFTPKRAGKMPVAAGDPVADWQAARQLYEMDEPIDLEVVGYNRGGLLVSFHSLQGFVPASHLIHFPNQVTEDERMLALSRKVGMTLKLKVIEYDPAKGRVVFSERAAQAGPGSRQAVLGRLRPGTMVTGVVTNVTDFGAFVDLGGIEGLIHVSEVSWSRVASSIGSTKP